MAEDSTSQRRLDIYSFEMIFVIGLIALTDFLLSDELSLPLVLRHSPLVSIRSLDGVVSSSEFLVPALVFTAMLILSLIRRNAIVRRLAIVLLSWVTLRLAIKIGLVTIIIASRAQTGAGPLLKDTIVMWVVNCLLFGVWYWIIDAGGPSARQTNAGRRIDFHFPQRSTSLSGWENWQPRIWDYLFLGFCGSTQFSLGDTAVLSLRAKFLMMLQAAMSLAVIVFIASIAIGALH